MILKPGDKVIYDPAPFSGEKAEGVVISANKWNVEVRVAPCDAYPGGLTASGDVRLTRVFEYEELQAQEWGDDGVSEPHALGNTLCIYEDKRTGLAVLDKRKYEAWITENGL